MRSFLRGLLGYFFSGFIFWFPIGIVVLIIGYVFSNLERFGESILGLFLASSSVYQGFGTILWLMLFLLTGLVLKKTPVGKMLSDVPILGLFFRKDGEIMTFERLSHLTPCLFLFSPTCLSYGWKISTEGVRLDGGKKGPALINVYYPNFPSLITGQVFALRKEAVMKLGNPSREVMDLFLFAVRSPENVLFLPWEDETEEDFLKRADSFGSMINKINTG